MTNAIKPPLKKNPQKKTVAPTRPPEMRSRAALGLSAAAAEGKFKLQQCSECDTIQYPPRDACHNCLSTDLPWCEVSPFGTLMAETKIHTSTNLFFRERNENYVWRMGTVELESGAIILCHVHGDVKRRAKVCLHNKLDRSGQGTIFALPMENTPNMADDPQLREFTCDPKHRRILISDAHQANTPQLAKALLEAGASHIFIGDAEEWRPHPNRNILSAMDNVSLLPLDITDTSSVQKLAGEIGGKVDIMINNARFIREGGVLSRGDTSFAKDEMETNYLGLMRLAQAFGGGMCSRVSDGVNSATAWVNILSVHALSNAPEYGCFSASNAAAYSLSQSLRAEFRSSGLRVINVFTGPTEDEWYQTTPPPKVLPAGLSRTVIQALQDGVEDAFAGDVAKEFYERFKKGHKILERELTMGGDA